MYLDAGFYRVTASVLEQDADVGVRSEHSLLQSGLTGVTDAFARRVADAFVRATRFNPFRHGESEQALYDRLPQWLEALLREERLELQLPYGGEDVRVTVERDHAVDRRADRDRNLRGTIHGVAPARELRQQPVLGEVHGGDDEAPGREARERVPVEIGRAHV